jgi:hypothetical protein
MIRFAMFSVVAAAVSPASAEVRVTRESRLEIAGEAPSACVVRAPVAQLEQTPISAGLQPLPVKFQLAKW